LLKGISLAQTYHSSGSQNIYIYEGPGTSSVAIKHTHYTMRKLTNGRYTIKTISPKEVCEGSWVNNAALFIMPGGADIPYAQALNGIGNEHIQAYVQKGGSYMGFCAGAYYGSQQIVFAKNTPLEVIGQRELAFFPGVTEGPTLKPWGYKTNAGADAALIHWQAPSGPFPKNHDFTVYYNGGGHFVNAESYPHLTVLATYAAPSPKAAIVEIGVGKGRVILCSVHCEFAPELFDMSDPFLIPVQKKLIPKDQHRLALMAHLLERLGIKTTSPNL
jgi:glutamine amidotransferase-like uncharacterized protein